jgi:predicted amidophosphoribosyltransferase
VCVFVDVVDNLVDLVWPRHCLGCGAGGSGLCAECLPVRAAVRFVPGLGPVHAAASYGGAVRAAIIHYKDRRRRDLRAPLAALLNGAVGAARAELAVSPPGTPGAGHPGVPGPGAAPLLVPVPSTTRAARERGGDHMRRLAASVARRQGLRADALLHVGRPIDDATGLGAAARAANVAGAYVCRRGPPSLFPPPTPGAPVILVDDVITTGASLREAARCLSAAGYRVQACAVIALVPAERRIGRDGRGSRR